MGGGGEGTDAPVMNQMASKNICCTSVFSKFVELINSCLYRVPFVSTVAGHIFITETLVITVILPETNFPFGCSCAKGLMADHHPRKPCSKVIC